MLVLSRKRNDTVVIGDDATLTVERISLGDDARGVSGATVRLGFQAPRHVSVARGELQRMPSRQGQGKRPPRKRPEGRLVDIADATIHLRIQVPQKIPVACNGTRLVSGTTSTGSATDTEPRTTTHYVSCHKDDRITICHNINIAMLDIRRFLPE